MTLNPQNRATSHILRVNCTKMTGDGPGQSAYDIFNIERTFFLEI